MSTVGDDDIDDGEPDADRETGTGAVEEQDPVNTTVGSPTIVAPLVASEVASSVFAEPVVTQYAAPMQSTALVRTVPVQAASKQSAAPAPAPAGVPAAVEASVPAEATSRVVGASVPVMETPARVAPVAATSVAVLPATGGAPISGPVAIGIGLVVGVLLLVRRSPHRR